MEKERKKLDGQAKLQEKLDSLQDSIRNLQARQEIRDTQTALELEDAYASAEGERNRLAEELRLRAEKTKSRAYADLLKVQMQYHQKKEQMKEDWNGHRETAEKAVLRKESLEAAEYADFMVQFANYAAQEANIAVIDAQRIRMLYEDTYGEDPDETDNPA